MRSKFSSDKEKHSRNTPAPFHPLCQQRTSWWQAFCQYPWLTWDTLFVSTRSQVNCRSRFFLWITFIKKVFFPGTHLEVIGEKLASHHREESQEKTMSELQSLLNTHAQRCIMAGEWSELCGPEGENKASPWQYCVCAYTQNAEFKAFRLIEKTSKTTLNDYF